MWIYDAGNGPTVDGVPLDFRPTQRRLVQRLRADQHRRRPPSRSASACTYTYVSRTPLQALINLVNIGMYDFTVFELNPT